MRKHLINGLLILFLISGCATKNELTVKEFTSSVTSNKFVPIALFIDDGTNNSGNAYAYDHHIFERVKESNLFDKVGTSSAGWPYTIFLEFNTTNNGSAADDIAFIASAATLFLLPTKSDFTFTLKATITGQNGLVKEYRYKDVREWIGGLWDANGKPMFDALDNLLNHFFIEIQNDNILPRVNEKNIQKSKDIAASNQ